MTTGERDMRDMEAHLRADKPMIGPLTERSTQYEALALEVVRDLLAKTAALSIAVTYEEVLANFLDTRRYALQLNDEERAI